MPRRRRLALAALAVLALAVLAVVPAAPLAAASWTVDDLVLAESAEEWVVAPDGLTAAWVKGTVETVGDEEVQAANLWRSDLATGASQVLTHGADQVAAPRFAPDGAHLAFLSDRALPPHLAPADEPPAEEAGAQLWVLPTAGGEARPVTVFERGVAAYDWIDDATLVVAAREPGTARERRREAAGDTAVAVEDPRDAPPVRLWRVELADGATRRLTSNRDWVYGVDVSPDGRLALVAAQRSLTWEFDQREWPRYALLDLATGVETPLFPGERRFLLEVDWEPGSAGFYFAEWETTHPTYLVAVVSRLRHHDVASGVTRDVDLGWERGLADTDDALLAVPGGVLALLADGVRFRPALVERQGDGFRRRDLAGVDLHHLQAWAASPDGRRVVYEVSSAVRPPQWYAAERAGDRLVAPRRVTDLDPHLAEKPTGRAEVVTWAGALGETVEGILHYPLDWREGDAPRPLVLDVHGGPWGVDLDAWSHSWGGPVILWRDRGAFVLQANYHGSSQYGLAWAESIAGRYYELEVPDLETGVDHLVERGLVDSARLAVAGWSNGGILAADLVTRTDRYRAAIVGAADVEWISDWANVSFGASFDNYYMGGPPWEVPDVYVAKSPFFRLAAVTTPTLVHTGTADTNVPPHQSFSLFRALREIGKAPVRLVVYPGEEHSLEAPAHQRRKIEEDVAWLERHLFGVAREEDDAVPPKSPLAALLARARAARAGGLLGSDAGGALVPETVPFAGLAVEVGRFEVTRAQLAAMTGDAVAPGEAELPAAGVDLATARAYAVWLAERTGRPYRLPTVDEAEALAAAGEDGDGNTLDRWLGYTATPDDAAAALAALAAAGAGPAPLLLPVGSFPGAGEPAVFDVDGNVAEWAEGDAGDGRLVGPSAERPADRRATVAPAPAYGGLRVVVGAVAAAGGDG